jgi:hypothetical protein
MLPPDPAVGLRQEAHDREGRDALSAARLAHDAERPAPVDVEAHAVHRPGDDPPGFESDGQVADPEQRIVAHGSLYLS